jgi:hypothetical protein
LLFLLYFVGVFISVPRRKPADGRESSSMPLDLDGSFISLFIYLFDCLFVYLFIYLFLYFFISLFFYLFLYFFIFLFIYFFIYLFVVYLLILLLESNYVEYEDAEKKAYYLHRTANLIKRTTPSKMTGSQLSLINKGQISERFTRNGKINK